MSIKEHLLLRRLLKNVESKKGDVNFDSNKLTVEYSGPNYWKSYRFHSSREFERFLGRYAAGIAELVRQGKY